LFDFSLSPDDMNAIFALRRTGGRTVDSGRAPRRDA
jgi:hypothetical protein